MCRRTFSKVEIYWNTLHYIFFIGHTHTHTFDYEFYYVFRIWILNCIVNMLIFFKNGQILYENDKISKITQIIKKSCVAILDNILCNLAKFQLSRSFWTWVISNFVKYQKIAILRFCQFFHPNWSKFSRL